MARTIFAFNGDLESRLALHWLAREQGYEVLAVSADLGQGVYLEPLGEIALELGATSARVVDLRETFLHDFCLPTLQADAIYQSGCFLGSALSRYAIARELVQLAHEEGCRSVAHSAASKGNDQVRMETAVAAQDPQLEVLAPVRHWHLRSWEQKLAYARRHRLPIDEPQGRQLSIDRNLWGVSLFLDDLVDSWETPPADIYQMTKSPEAAPNQAAELEIRFEAGEPRLPHSTLPHIGAGKGGGLLALVTELNRLGGEHGVGRNDMIEDRLFAIKSREMYEAPAATILLTAHQALQSLVQSRDLINLKDVLSRRYAEQVYSGFWFSDLRRSIQGFITETQQYVTGDVRLKLYKGSCAVVGRRSPHSLYDSRLASQSNQEFFNSDWVHGFTSLWTLPARLTARQREGLADRGKKGWMPT